jgi:hypothetical protein
MHIFLKFLLFPSKAVIIDRETISIAHFIMALLWVAQHGIRASAIRH